MKKVFQNIAKSVFDLNAWWAFAFICIFYWIAMAFQQYFILTDEVYFNSLGEQLAYERIEDILDKQKSQAWLGYALTPLIALIQIFLIVICLNIGTILMVHPDGSGRGDRVKFRQLFSLVSKVMLIPAFLKIVLLCSIYFFYHVKSLDDLTNTFSFSLANFYDLKSLPVWLQYPLLTINLVELLFWLLLARGIQYLLKLDFSRSISFVGYTYGIGLLMWMLFVVFLQVSLS